MNADESSHPKHVAQSEKIMISNHSSHFEHHRKESLRKKFEEKENVSYFHRNMARSNKTH